MSGPTNSRSHRWIAAVAAALPWLVGCGTSHQEKTPMPQPVTPRLSAEQPPPSSEPAAKTLQTATFALG